MTTDAGRMSTMEASADIGGKTRMAGSSARITRPDCELHVKLAELQEWVLRHEALKVGMARARAVSSKRLRRG
jgi:hypothetical protein